MVSPATQSDTIDNTTVPLTGIGVYKREFMGANTTAVYTSCYLSVVDGHSFKPIEQKLLLLRAVTGGEALGRLLFNGMMQSASLHPFFLMVDRSYFADDFSQLTLAQKAQIQETLKSLLQQELPVTLSYLKSVSSGNPVKKPDAP